MKRYLRYAMSVGLYCLATVGGAEPAQPSAGSPAHFQFTVAGTEITALFDGYVDFEQSWFLLPEAQSLTDLLGDLPALAQDPIPTSVNGYVIRQGDATVLVDVGAGHCFGSGLGKLGSHLERAGFSASDIDLVLLTHLHPDHVCGLTSESGAAHFDNATIWMADAEAAFWLDTDLAELPEEVRSFFVMARDAFAPYPDERVKRFAPGVEILPGLLALPAHGHTPGHVGFLVKTGGQDILVWGDVMHNHDVQMVRPDISISADTDPDAARMARLEFLRQAVAAGWLVAAAHLPFPGLGEVQADGDHFRWVPVATKD